MTAQNATRGSALSGIRVLDLGRVVAAPYAAQLLGDLGADVIKVERPRVGDDVRAYVSPNGPTSVSAYFASNNRNKRSITIDIARPEGQAIVRKLARDVDVLIENYVPGTMERYGLDYATLSAANPGLVYCSITGFGHTGPFSERPGMDHIFQARGGLMSVIGVPSDQPNAGPVQTGIVITDCTTGRDAANAILAALFERTRSGQGQHIDIALLDSAVGLFSYAAQEYLLTGRSLSCDPGAGVKVAWSGFLDCADGKIFILSTRDPWFNALCEVLGVPEVAKDPRFSTSAARNDHRPEVPKQLAPAAKRWKKFELAEALAAAGVPAGPVNNAEEVLADPQVQARGMVIPMPASYDPDLRGIRSTVNLSRTPPSYRRPPPALGEHTREILEELGYDAADIEKLRSSGAI